MSRTRPLSSVFVKLAGALKSDFDLFEFYDSVCRQAVALFEVGGAGLLFPDSPDSPDRLRALAASGRAAWTLGHLQARQREGPCVEGLTRRETVLIRDLTTARRWPKFVEVATRHGYGSTAAVPLQRNGQVLVKMPVELSKIDAQGRIQQVGRLPLTAITPGTYQLHVVVTDGNSTLERTAYFQVVS